ncbi:DNA-directed RNA polymerase subunit H [Candidatus Altiarchaeota archaeon]
MVERNKLVPKHELMDVEAAQKVLAKYNVSPEELPKIKKDDPALEIFSIKPEAGDIIQITRENAITGTSLYYRTVIEG